MWCGARYSVYLLYWYKSTNTDAEHSKQCYDTHHDSSAAERLSNDIASKALDNPEIDPSRVLVIVTSQYAWEGTKPCISSFRPPLAVAFFFLASYFYLVTSQDAWRVRSRALVALGRILVFLVALGLIH